MEQSSTYKPGYPENGQLRFDVSPEKLPQFLIRANEAINVGRVKEAAVLLSDRNVEVVCRMVAQEPSRTDVMFMLGLMFSKIGQPLKAEEWYKKVLEHEPHPLVYHELGRIARGTGRLSEATRWRRKAVEIDPDNTVLRTSLALDLIREGNTEEGI